MTSRGSIHLFRFAGVDVFLHWSWFLVAMVEIQGRAGKYGSLTWNVLEYLALFLIVLLHEYGHALACRQVGGRADQIVLWPLGGVAYVNPPPRPGATLWSIAAGPLVNVALLPALTAVGWMNRNLGWGWATAYPNFYGLLRAIWFVNLGLLIFNLLPIYPLDGGQILRALLWYPLGRARSLMAAAGVGFVGVAGLFLLALMIRSVWLGVLAAFILMSWWGGLQHARALARLAKLPRREGYLCPECGAAPPVGEQWKCPQCGNQFDTFATQAACPHCAARFAVTSCPECGRARPMSEWMAAKSVASSW